MSELTSIHTRILGRYKKAKAYAETDPEVALSEARKTAEAIYKHVYTSYATAHPDNNDFKKPAEKQMLNDMASRLEKVKAVPLVVSTAIRTIQAFGNIGSHDQGEEADHVTTESIKAPIAGLETVVRWFWKQQELSVDMLDLQAISKAPTPRSVDTPVAETVTPTTAGNRIRNIAIGVVAAISALSALAGLFADSISTVDQLSRPSTELVTAQASANGLFKALGDPAPNTDCYGDDHSQIIAIVGAGELLKGAIPHSIRPQEREALATLDKITDEHPGQAIAWALLAQAQLTVQSDAASISKSAQVAAGLCSDWAFPSNIMGNASFRNDDLDSAEVSYKMALGLYPEYAAPRFNLAMIALKRQDYTAADHELTRLLALHPHHKNAHLVRGQARMLGGSNDGALEDLRAAIEQDSRNPAAYVMLGQLLGKFGETIESKEALCRAKALGHPLGEKLCPKD